MRKLRSTNPVVSKVIDQFNAIEEISRVFTDITDPGAIRGLLISGDAGMGKTYFVEKGLRDAESACRVVGLKGSSITAGSLYARLWEAREPGKVLVLDDVDIIHKSPQELNTILSFLKAATEMTKGERIISWERIKSNPFMVSQGIESSFDFQGTIVWITNNTIDEIQKRCKAHFEAINSRFTTVSVRLTAEQKLQYTLHLLTEEDILGTNCMVREGGYSDEIIQTVYDYVYENYNSLPELTPRYIIGIASTIHKFPTTWKNILNSTTSMNTNSES